MASEIDELSQLLEKTNRELLTFNQALSKNIRSETIFNNSLKTSAEITEESAEEEKKRKRAISNAISGLAGFTKQLSSSQGSFAPLTSIISTVTKAVGKWWSGVPVLGKALESVVTGAGEVTNFMIESFDKAYGTFEKLSSSGVVETFETMKMTAGAMNLNYSQTENVLSKHSKNLALFAGSALQGRKEFERLAYNSIEVRNSFQKLGISGEEFSDMQLNYINEQRLANRGQAKNIGDMTNSSVEYIKNLDAISKLTGMSKKGVQDIRKEISEDVSFRASNVGVAESIVDNQKNFLVLLNNKIGPEFEKGTRDLMSHINSTTDAANKVRASMGNNLTEYLNEVKGVKNGTSHFASAIDKVVPIVARQSIVMGTHTQVLGINSKATALQGEMFNARIELGKDINQQYNDILAAQNQNLEDTTSVNAQLANTKISLEKSQRSLEQLATDGSAVTWLMSEMAKGISKLTTTVYKLSGEAMPEHLVAQKEEYEALDEERDARAKVNKRKKELENLPPEQRSRTAGIDSLGSLEQQRLTLATARLKTARENRKAADLKYEKSKNRTGSTSSSPTGQPIQPGSQASPGQADNSRDYQGLNIGGKYPGEATAGGPSSKNIIALARKLQAAYPGGTFSAFNDTFDRGSGSKHKQGLAFDYTLQGVPKGETIPRSRGKEITDFLRSSGASNAIDEYNNPTGHSTGGHIHAEVTARTGGIFSGPESGYLAELHGTEAVVPSNFEESGSVSKQSLGSGLLKPKSNNLEKVFSNLSEKMDSLIDLMEYSMENQKKFLEAKLS